MLLLWLWLFIGLIVGASITYVLFALYMNRVLRSQLLMTETNTNMREWCIAYLAADESIPMHTTPEGCAARAIKRVNKACDEGKLGYLYRELTGQVR